MRGYPREYKYSRKCAHAWLLATKDGATTEDALAGIRKLRKVVESGVTSQSIENLLDNAPQWIRTRHYESVAVQVALISFCELRGDSVLAFTTICLLLPHTDEEISQAAEEAAYRFMKNFLSRHPRGEAERFLEILRYVHDMYLPHGRTRVATAKLIIQAIENSEG